MRHVLATLALVLLVASLSTRASAHEFRPAVLAVQELEGGEVAISFQPPLDGAKRPIEAVRPELEPGCSWSRPDRVRCPSGVDGGIRIEGLSSHPVDVVVRAAWRDGTTSTVVLRGRDDTFHLGARGADAASSLSGFVLLGIEHIAFGIDHVLFVLGLALLVGFSRRLLWTVTGFTLAHSVTLAAATLGLVSLPQGPVEAAIAISIVLVAVEVVHDRPSLTRRLPGVVAFAFGLLHGFGFAGALAEVGLPAGRTGLALLGFNLGVEAGQIAILAAAFAVTRPWPERLRPRARLAAAYAGGVVATAWTFQRVAALL